MSLTAARSDCVFAPEGSGDRSELYVRSKTGPERYWLLALRTLGVRHRRMHDTRHTFARVCLMSTARLVPRQQTVLLTSATRSHCSMTGCGLYTLNILPHGAQCAPQPGSSVKGPDLKGFKQYVRISWSISKALDKGFQRLLRPRRVPQGNISWYKKWYEIHPPPASCRPISNTRCTPTATLFIQPRNRHA